MTPNQVNAIVAKVYELAQAFEEVDCLFDANSDVMSNPEYFPFSESFDDVKAKVSKWADHLGGNLQKEVTWYDRNRGIVSLYFGEPDIQQNSADWVGHDVWVLDEKATTDGELIRQCILVANEDSNATILTIRTDHEDGDVDYNDILHIHEDERNLHGLMQILTRHK